MVLKIQYRPFSDYSLPALVLTLTTSVFGQTCHRTNCQQTTGNLAITHASFIKVPDAKLNYWAAIDSVVGITGTQEERERTCIEACIKKGVGVCKSADLSEFNPAGTSTCHLFDLDAYNHTNAATIHHAWAHYTTFHLKVFYV